MRLKCYCIQCSIRFTRTFRNGNTPETWRKNEEGRYPSYCSVCRAADRHNKEAVA